MTDITTMLRTGEFRHIADLTAEAAADEIDRLRAEVARLREALAVIAYPVGRSKLHHADAVAQARFALKEGK